VVKKGGFIVAGTNIKNSLSWRLFKFFLGGDPTHIHEFTAQKFIDFIGQSFKIKKSARSSCIGRFPKPLNKIFHWLLKGDILVKGVKR